MNTGDRKQREIREREQQILETAQGILVAEGYHGLNMDRIAEALEYSKGTIYNHFPCKEEIIIALAIDTGQRRLALFERASSFRGGPRERMTAIGVAAEVFYRLHAHRFLAEQIVRSTSIWEKTSESRRIAMHSCEARCMGVLAGIVRDGIARGDLALPDGCRPEDLVFGLWTLTLGAYEMISDNQSLLDLGISEPFLSVRNSQTFLVDGYQWHPLSTEHDYDAVRKRVSEELFADEFRAISG